MGDVVDERQTHKGPIKVSVFGRTDVGLVREHNEDNFLVADLAQRTRTLLPSVREHEVGSEGSLFAVCDGMGGAAAGEVASQLAVDTLHELMQGEEAPTSVHDMAAKLEDAVLESGRRIYESARADRTRRGMGTTITAASLVSERIVFAQVGDSRAYLIRQGKLVQVTRDQSLVNQLIEAGQLKPEEADLFEHSNIILQALGTAEDVTVDLTYVDLCKGDVLLMCSDGLSGLVTDDQICELANADRQPIGTCRALTEAAREGGGHDNITVIVAVFDGEGLPQPDWSVEFQRLSIPGRLGYADRNKTTTAWSSSRGPRSTDRTNGAPPDGKASKESSRAEPLPAKTEQGNSAMAALVALAVLAIGVGFGYVFVSGRMGPEAQGTDPEGMNNVILQAPVACHFVPDAPGTRLVIDGQDYGDIPAVGRWIDLAPGRHSIEARRDNEVMSRQDLVLEPGQERVVVPLTVATASLLDLGSHADAGGGQHEDANSLQDGAATVAVPTKLPGAPDGGLEGTGAGSGAPAAAGLAQRKSRPGRVAPRRETDGGPARGSGQASSVARRPAKQVISKRVTQPAKARPAPVPPTKGTDTPGSETGDPPPDSPPPSSPPPPPQKVPTPPSTTGPSSPSPSAPEEPEPEPRRPVAPGAKNKTPPSDPAPTPSP